MTINELFKKNISRSIQGVVTIGNEDEEQKWQELEEYVCTDEITRCFRTFFRRYRESIQKPTEKIGVWVTGFFGSGKSHFLKILGYILDNEVVAGVEAAKYFDTKISDEMVLADLRASAKVKNKVVLFNIDSKAKSDSKTKSQAIMDIMIRAFNESVGYCGSMPWVADMERTLDNEGSLEAFIEKFEELSHRKWAQNRAKALLNRDYIIKALCETRGMSEDSAKSFVEDQIRNFTNTTEDFAKLINDYCVKNKTRVVFLMDEVGQFIGDNTQLMLNLQTCVEDLGKYCKGQAWVVITSQQELKAMIDSTKDRQQDFSKIQGRFNTRILLSGANADEVIKKRILEKKNTAVNPLKALYEANASKLSNLILFQAKPTWSGYKDSDDFAAVYPFVSYQFELLQKVFEAIREHGMSEGRHLSQNERSLLDAFQRAAKKNKDASTGILVPFDTFYDTIEEFIDYDIKTVFSNAERRTSLDPFALRVLRVLFMVKHVKEMPATIDRLATLLVEGISEDKAALKQRIADALVQLEAETLIQKNGEEYDFLTNAEQDVNIQINNTPYNEGEVQRTVDAIIYDKILENNKYRYEGRYDFALNRFVDSEQKGAFSQDAITLKIFTQFSGVTEASDFGAESVRSNGIVVDLTSGSYLDELIRANKIATFKRNNSAAMSAQLAEIMSKKSAELSDRTSRAEDIIRQSLRTAPIYLNGQQVDIKEKDGKDRLQDALKAMVKQDYYNLGLVTYFYNDQHSITEVLERDVSLIDADYTKDANAKAYSEILGKIKNDKALGRRVTVKSLLDSFSKKPYGWRDNDILGILAELWKQSVIQILIHDNLVDDKNRTFKTDFVRKSGIDTMVVKMPVKIDDAILYQVKRIMNDVYSVTLPLTESKLLDGVQDFFSEKKDFIAGLKSKNGSDYVGAAAAMDIYKDFDAILKSNDPSVIFHEIIARKDDLEERAETLEQLEAFHKNGSGQQHNYKEAAAIVDWYNQNALLEDLSRLSDVVDKMSSILSMELPFDKMAELGKLVFDASEIKKRILDDKLATVVEKLKKDAATIQTECSEALNASLTDGQKDRISDKANEIHDQYESWFAALGKAPSNMDSYTTASVNTVKGFRQFIAQVMAEGAKKPVRTKRVSLIDCIPVAGKKVTSAADVDKVLASIKSKLLAELKDNDELNLN